MNTQTTNQENVSTLICGNDKTNIYKVEDKRQLYPQPYEKDYLNTHYFFSPYLSFGDYDNSCNVERSNVRIFEEMFKDTKNIDWIKLSGDYSSESIGIKLSCINPEIIETLQSLENYPALDDEDCGLVTMEMENDALESYLLSEFKEKVIKFYGADDTEADDREFMNLYYELKEKTNTYEEIESGGNFYIDLERLIQGLDENQPENLKLITY